MNFSRRTFLRLSGAAGAAAVTSRAGHADASVAARQGQAAVLVDTTRCVGCRACEAACAEANRLPGPARAGDAGVFDARRALDPATFTVVNRTGPNGGPATRFVKTQCMHCVEPACASACLARALEKTASGPVVYHADRCLGCRYCMVACPFDVPKFEYASASPYVRKCTFCSERQAQGLPPACTAACPTGALTFGTREALLDEARTRIYATPGAYVRHIYGDEEAGGTSWMYISDRPLAELGFDPSLPRVAYSSLTQSALSVVPMIITVWPPLLMGLYTFSQRRNAIAAGADPGPEGSSTEETRHA